MEVFDAIAVRGQVQRAGQVINIPANSGTVGAGAGMTSNNNTGIVACPQSITAGTWTIPVRVKQGAVIKSFKVSGQIESAGNTCTVDVDLRKTTGAAADLTDASLGAITQISKTADYKIVDSKTLATPYTVISGDSVYALVTITTAAATDVALQGIELTVDEN